MAEPNEEDAAAEWEKMMAAEADASGLDTENKPEEPARVLNQDEIDYVTNLIKTVAG